MAKPNHETNKTNPRSCHRQQPHSFLLHLQQNPSILRSLTTGRFSLCKTLFTHMPNPNIFDYNSIITSYTTNSQFHKLFFLFNKMLNTNIRPNSHTFTTLVKACVSLSSLEQVFTLSMKLGNSSDVYFVSSVINAFSKHSAIHLARQVFDESSNRNVVCWTSLVIGYCSCGSVKEARDVFDKMPQRNEASYSAMVSGYVRNGFFSEGVQWGSFGECS